MGSESLLSVLVAIIAAAMILQSIVVLLFVLSIRKSLQHMEALLAQLTQDIQPVLQSAREFLTERKEKFNAIFSMVSAISANVLEISSVVKGQVGRLDGLLTEAGDRARLQLIRVDELLADTVTRVEETGQVVQRAVLAPVREITAILTGVRTTLDIFFRRNKRGVEHATQDEELFI